MNLFSLLKSLIRGMLGCLFLIIVVPDGVAQENQKKEKKAITAFIKSEYASWASADLQDPSETSQLIVHPSLVTAGSKQIFEKTGDKASTKFVTYNSEKIPEPQQRFREFDFTIENHQAIVRFCVDDKMISAFLEKEDGKWKLVCAAPLGKIL